MSRARGRRSAQTATSAASPAPARSLHTLWIALALVALAVVVYAPVRHYEFVNFDDGPYVAQNPEVLNGLTWSGMQWAFTTGHAGNWHPLTWISHMLDVQLFGVDPHAFHVTNLVLHAANTALLFCVLFSMTGARWRSALVAALFAVHPLHVESVAWIAERKDVLSTLFWILTIGAYVAYVRRPGAARYVTLVVTFALGLLSKPMLVTLPFVLLLLDVWPLGKARGSAGLKPGGYGSLFIEKLPLFALAAASSVVTFIVQQHAGAVRSFDVLPFGQRVANAVVAYVIYLVKTIWPSGLAAIYPYRAWPLWIVVGAVVVLAGITAAVVRARAARPYLVVGWLIFLGTLVPVIGIVQVGSQPVADRYMYVPAIGLFIMCAWGLADLARLTRPAVVAGCAAVLVIAGAVTARAQVASWANGVALWEHAVAVTRDNARAYNNLGQALAKENRMTEAIAQYRTSLQIVPDSVEAHTNLGLALGSQGHVDEAVEQFTAAARLNPGRAEGHVNLGSALASLGRLDEAIGEFNAALTIDPSLSEAHVSLGLALTDRDQPADAIPHFQQALRLTPADARAEHGWARALADLDKLDDALAHLDAAIRLEPTFAAAHHDRGRALLRLSRADEALRALALAAQYAPRDPDVHYDLAVALAQKGRTADAINVLQRVLALDPSNADAAKLLATLRK